MDKKRKSPSHFLVKKWDPIFAKDRIPKEKEPYVDWKRKINAVGDELDLFLEDEEISVPSPEIENVKFFSREACLESVKLGTGVAGEWRRAFFDDRSCIGSEGGGCAKECNNPLTATELYGHLKRHWEKLRFDGFNPSRRLIYIKNLNPSYILALSETAPEHQVPALREAIWNHLAFQSSIGVKFPTRGYKVFQFEFHLPHFALCMTPPAKNCLGTSEVSHQQERWISLSFLNTQPPTEAPPRLYGIYKAQFSLAICGSDNRRWTAYAFNDSDYDSEDLISENVSPEGIYDPDASDNEQQAKPPTNWDPILEQSNPTEFDAEQVIWDPREYFLMGVEVGIAKPLQTWKYLVRSLERDIEQYIRRHSSALTLQSGGQRHGLSSTGEALGWTESTMQVLNQLSGVISKTNKASEVFFNELGGNIGYFSDIVAVGNSTKSRALYSIDAIKTAFKTLENLEDKLALLEKSCSTLIETLKLRLNLEAAEVAQRNNEVLQKSYEEAKETKEVLQKSYEEAKEANGVLQKSYEEAREANGVLQKSYEEAKEANGVLQKSYEEAREANGVLRKSYEEAREAKEVLKKSCEEAREAKEVLRKSYEEAKEANEEAKQVHKATTLTIWIFTPIGLTATIFNMSEDIVPFNMNFGSFIISSLVMMAVVLLFLGSSRKSWWKIIAAPIETLHLSGIAQNFWTGEYNVRFMMRRWRRSNDNMAMEGVELPTTVGVQRQS